jgi:hypothetical protein
MIPNHFMVVPGSVGLSVLVILTTILFVFLLLYFGRTPAHRAIRTFSYSIRNGMRMSAKSVMLAERWLARRNKEVLLAMGQESVERTIEREFHRVDAVVKRDLSGYPELQRMIADQIVSIEEDYRESAEIKPPAPEWVEAVDAVAKISSRGDSTVVRILEDIHKTVTDQFKTAMQTHRRSMTERHSLLRRMTPYWRRLAATLEKVGKTISGLQERAMVIDKKMEEYEAIRSGAGEAERVLTSSALTQFFISAFVLLIATGGAIINFNLIALPMSEMVGGGSYIGNFQTSHVAALVIILVELAMGLYLMESLRITKLFPIIGSMDDRLRIKMLWITFLILLTLACVESALAFMRDVIASDMQALRQTLSDSEVIRPANNWIPTVGQMVMGFILPFALTFVAIPLESFIQSFRTVMGVIVVLLLRWFAFFLRLIGSIVLNLGNLLINIYDFLIIPFLWIESMFQKRMKMDTLPSTDELNPQEETA